MQYESLDQFIKDLPIHAERHADQLRGHDTTALLVTREGKTLFIALRDGHIDVSNEAQSEPDCTVTAAQRDLLDMINGKLNPVKAVLFRKIVIKGDAGKLMALARMV